MLVARAAIVRASVLAARDGIALHDRLRAGFLAAPKDLDDAPQPRRAVLRALPEILDERVLLDVHRVERDGARVRAGQARRGDAIVDRFLLGEEGGLHHRVALQRRAVALR